MEQAQFIDDKHGWIMGTGEGAFIPDPKNPGSGQIPSIMVFWSTTNGGKTWQPVLSHPPLRDMSDVHFLDSKHGYAIYRNVLFATEDGGTTWRQVYPWRMAHHVHVKPVL